MSLWYLVILRCRLRDRPLIGSRLDFQSEGHATGRYINLEPLLSRLHLYLCRCVLSFSFKGPLLGTPSHCGL
jgi:hypothetical protein